MKYEYAKKHRKTKKMKKVWKIEKRKLWCRNVKKKKKKEYASCEKNIKFNIKWR